MAKMQRIKANEEIINNITLVSNEGNKRNFNLKKAEYPTLQKGNKKIINTDKYNVLAWSIASQATLNFINKTLGNYSDQYTNQVNNTLCHNCESCVNKCYNISAYRQKSVIISRFSNFYHTFDKNFVHNMITMINNENEKSKEQNKKLFVRLHVDGEIYNYNYATKLMEICYYFENDNNVTFYTYTKSYEIIKQLELCNLIPSNININLSLFDDMDKKLEKYILNESKHNVFYASKDGFKALKNNKYIKVACKGFDCANCSLCSIQTKNKMIITTPIH